MRRFIFCLSVLLFLLPNAALADEEPRFPGPAVLTAEEQACIRENGHLARSLWLDAGLTLLEEGNPFTERYNLLTGAQVRPRLALGVPYLYGGQAASRVFAKEPDYVVLPAGHDSPAYYVEGCNYIYGFDCVGFLKWLWSQVRTDAWPTCDGILEDDSRHILDPNSLMPDWESISRMLCPGDILVMRHPWNHIALYIGTLRDFGYTAEDVPALAEYLDYPLVLHSSTNAAMAPRFAWLIENGLPKYHGSRTTDGGVCIAILGVPRDAVPSHVFAQNQHTWYFPLPDGTWLPVLLWENVTDYCWWRPESQS